VAGRNWKILGRLKKEKSRRLKTMSSGRLKKYPAENMLLPTKSV
jgi:hypothetical protein